MLWHCLIEQSDVCPDFEFVSSKKLLFLKNTELYLYIKEHDSEVIQPKSTRLILNLTQNPNNNDNNQNHVVSVILENP